MTNVKPLEPIGYTQSNRLIKIPVNCSLPELELFLEAFFIDDLVDIFCMVEFLDNKHKYNANIDPRLLKSADLLIDIFYRFKRKTYFGELLKSSELGVISERINLGQRLILPKFRNI